jgi:hypothetical protein
VAPSWSEVKAAWSAGWKALEAEGRRLYEGAIRLDPGKFASRVKAFLTELSTARAHLDSVRRKLPNPPRTEDDRRVVAKYQALEARYATLAAGFYSDARPAADATGAVPILVVGGLVVGVAAIAWSIAAYEYAVNLREETALADRELSARVDASRDGRILPPSTLPEPTDPKKAAKNLGLLLVGGLALVAGVVALPVLLKKAG